MKLQRKSGVRALTVGAVAISGALLLTACGSDDNASSGASSSSSASSSGSIKCADKAGQILASGSSAQQNAIDLWVQKYQAACSGTTINYKASSSGEGIIDFNQGTDAFAGSDSPLKPEEVTASKAVCTGGTGISIPMVGGPIAIGYNLSGVDNLVLDAATIGNIFNSKITYWDDAAIKALNSGVTLPHTKIQAFHRQDESGTTDNLTKYLSGAAPRPGRTSTPRPSRARAASPPPSPPVSRPRSSRPTARSATSRSPTRPRTASRPPRSTPAPPPRSRPPPPTPPRASPRARSSAPARTCPWTCPPRTSPRPTTPTRSSW